MLVERKKSFTKLHILHDSIYMKCPDYANPQRQKVDEWLPRVGERERVDGEEK